MQGVGTMLIFLIGIFIGIRKFQSISYLYVHLSDIHEYVFPVLGVVLVEVT